MLGAEKKGDQHPFAVCREGSHCKAVWCHVSLQGREVRVGWLCVCSREGGRGEREREKKERNTEKEGRAWARGWAPCAPRKKRAANIRHVGAAACTRAGWRRWWCVVRGVWGSTRPPAASQPRILHPQESWQTKELRARHLVYARVRGVGLQRSPAAVASLPRSSYCDAAMGSPV